MCDDHGADSTSAATGTALSRRNFVHGSAALAAAAALTGRLARESRLPLRSPARPVTADGSSAYSMAMHIHSSFSEQQGSMDSQLFQASTNSVDVLWWTDHDARMEGIGYRDTVHFTSLETEAGGPGQGGAWHWKKVESGPLASGASGRIVSTPCSPNDPVPGGSMKLTAQSSSTATAKLGFYADSRPARWNYRDNLTGQSLSIDVLLKSGWSDGYLELLIGTSYHEASGGRPAGYYYLSYRFVPAGGQAGRLAQGNTGVITIPVAPSGGDPWYTATLTPADDIAALWPDLDYRDFALYQLTLSAASTGDLVTGHFDYLRFNRSLGGEVFLEQQAEMMAALAPGYPGVTQQQGLEISWLLPHLNWFGSNVVMTDYGKTAAKNYAEFLAGKAVPQIHAAGGLVSYNHPFGYLDRPLYPVQQQNAILATLAAELLPSGSTPAVLGCDLLEVGYNARGGVNLGHLLQLWDIMSRNAVFLTGTGVSDDHHGTNWLGIYNNWISSAWAASTAQSDLLAALAAGRVWCGALSTYRGSLDLLVDGSCPMGSASVSSLTSRQLTASATGIPANGSLQVLQGAVDYAGSAGLTGNSQVIAAYPAAELAGGSVALPIDTSADSYVRTQVLGGSGNVIGLSNPAWLLQHAPSGGIPAPRQA
jgi:hypothetical protein